MAVIRERQVRAFGLVMVCPQRWRDRSAMRRLRIPLDAIDLSNGHKDLKFRV